MAWHSVAVVAAVAVATLALGIAVSGCGPHVTYDRGKAPEFDFRSLVQGGIAVLGATTTRGTWDERVEEREALTHSFEDALLRERKDLKVLRVSEIRTGMGEVPFEDLLDGWDRYAELSTEELAALDSLIGARCRYVALGRIEDAEVSNDETEDTSGERAKTTLRTTRTVRISFRVYDLQTARSAWNPTLTGSDDNEETIEEDEDEGGLLDALISGLVEGLLGLGGDPEYPEAPSTDRIAAKVFIRFVKELPRKQE